MPLRTRLSVRPLSVRLPGMLTRDFATRAGHTSTKEVSIPTRVAQILAENHARFLRFLERRVGGRELAEEILQDAFVRGLSHAGEIEDSESAVAWFYRLLRNALVDHYRRRDSERRALEAAAAQPAEPAASPDDELMTTVCACVDSMLATLKPDYADAIRRVDMHGESVSDFAHGQGITANNAAVRVHRARQALRRRLEESCGTCAEHACLDCSCRAATTS
jgi:RNA polymerase sigma factor (sigma-70 family)